MRVKFIRCLIAFSLLISLCCLIKETQAYYDGTFEPVLCTIDDYNVSIDVNNGALFNIHPRFGGKIIKETLSETMWYNLDALKQLSPAWWIWTQNCNPDVISTYRWDTHSIVNVDPPGYEEGYGLFQENHLCEGDRPIKIIPWVDGDSQLGYEYWKAGDMRHCAFFEKVANSTKAYASMMNYNDENVRLYPTDFTYHRIYFMIDDDVTFTSPANDQFEICRLNGCITPGNQPCMRVFITQDLRLNVNAYSYYNGQPNYATTLNASGQFTAGTWHTLELRYDFNSASATATYWLDGLQVDSVSGLDTTNLHHACFSSLNAGCVSGTTAAGKVYIDAVRCNDSNIGVTPGDPRDVLMAATFDDTPITVDDFMYYVEQCEGIIPSIQVAMYPPKDPEDPDNGQEHNTPQYSADLVEYLTGTADANYETLAAQLDYTHSTPSDNWANLRAARGRVAPYNVLSFQMGCEPYWQEKWPQANPSLYANDCLARGTAMKNVNGNIAIGVHLHAQLNPWCQAVLQTNENILDWVCVTHDYNTCFGGYYLPDSNAINRLLGCPSSLKDTTDVPFIWQHTKSREQMQTYFQTRTDYDEIITIQDEHGYDAQITTGEGANLAYGIHRFTYNLETMIHGGEYAWVGDWLLLTDKGYTYGVIGDNCLSPAYWAYRMLYENFGTVLLPCTVTSNENDLILYNTESNPDYHVPYISAYASVNDNGNVMSIAIVNRHRIDTINVNVDIDNYLDPYTNYTANVYTLGGSGYTWDSTNLEDPDNVVPQQSQISFTGGDFTYSAEPLSITIIEVSTIQPQSYHFAYTGEISPGVYGVQAQWDTVQGATGYWLEWGPSAAQPYGGTEDYPPGYAETSTNSFDGSIADGDTVYTQVKAILANGNKSAPSSILKLNILPGPANCQLGQNGYNVDISWNTVAGASGYIVYASEYGATGGMISKDYYDNVGSLTQASYTVPSSSTGTWYFMVIPYNETDVEGRPGTIMTASAP